MGKFILFAIIFLSIHVAHGQKTFVTETETITIRQNSKTLTSNWSINASINPDILEIECKEGMNVVTFSDQKDSISFTLTQNQTIDFIILKNGTDTAHTRIIGVAPNVNFSKDYIRKNKGKTLVKIPEVSELVNIIMALHKDAEKDKNMFDTKTAYYEKVKKYFGPYQNHPIFDTLHKYINGISYYEEHDMYLFSNDSYGYYYALKMNACSYDFNKKGKIINKGIIKTIAKNWYFFDPMKDISMLEDFAEKSNFRKFYKDNQPYYDSLLVTYNQLNPIQEMQNWLDKKFEFSYGSYVIYFSPLVHGAHSTRGFTEDNFSQTLMFICRAELDLSYSPVLNELLESRVVFTEIDHNYVNPVSDQFIERINISFSNRANWAPGEITEAYNDPYKVFNEYMTFAVYTLYVYDNYSNENLTEYLPMLDKQMSEQRGFIKFKEFNAALLEKYKQNPTIKITDLYDYILTWAAEINNQ